MPSLRRTRRKMQKHATRLIVWGGFFLVFLIGTFTSFSWRSWHPEGVRQLPTTVARINGENISRTAYDQAIAYAQGERPTVADWAMIKWMAFEQLAQQVLLRQEANRRRLWVTRADLDRWVNEQVQLELALARQRYQQDKAFRDFIRKRFGSLQGYENELRQQLAQQADGARETILQQKLRDEVFRSVKVTEKDLRDAYTQFRVRHLFVSFARFLPKGKSPTPQDQEQARQKALEHAKKLRQRLLNGEDFAALARKESDDVTTKEKGGDLGELSLDFARARLGDAVAQALPRLKVGETSEPLQGWAGYHLLRLDGKRLNLPPDYEHVRYRCEDKKCGNTWVGEKGARQCPKCKGTKIKVVGTRKNELLAQLRSQRQGEAFQRLLNDLRQQAKVEFIDPELRALYAHRNGDWKEAESAYQEALKLASQSPDARRHFLYPEVICLQLSRLAMDEGKLAEAERFAREALKYSDDNELHLHLGSILMLRAKRDEALKVFLKVANRSLEPYQRQRLASYLEQLGRKDLAEQQRKLAEKERPPSSGINLPLKLP
jgi:tetratricopeptide (TPR) repeat protein